MPRVLIVEDAPNYQEWLTRAMRRIVPDCSLECAHDVASAEERIEAGTPDIVVLDLGLSAGPRSAHADPLVGLELLRRLRAQGLPSRVVVLSSYTALAAESLQAGADGFVPKDTRELFAALQTAVTGSG